MDTFCTQLLLTRMRTAGDWQKCPVCRRLFWNSLEAEAEICGQCEKGAERLGAELTSANSPWHMLALIVDT